MNDDAILAEFLAEGREGVERLELDLLALEARSGDPELLAGVCRTLHSLKSTAGFLGFEGVGTLSHRGEDVLVALRDDRLELSARAVTLLLGVVDALRTRLDGIEATGTDDGVPDPELLSGLRRLAAGEAVVAAVEAPSPAPSPAAPVAAYERFVRVDVDLLDDLVDLAGELVLVRGRLASLAPGVDPGLAEAHRHLRRISGGLADRVREARLVPVGGVLRKLPRAARDLAEQLGKEVEVTLEGEEVGVDRAVSEALDIALLHLVRNAVDHGLEPPEERAALGKPRAGRLRIAARQEGGRARLELTDDGGGIDGDRLAARAVDAGLVSGEAARELSPGERRELMFRPGLSARATASAVSGRGVGLDAVRQELARVGGTVEVESAPGTGTTFRIDVPLTLAIVPCLVVRVGDASYCVPQADVREVAELATAAPEAVGAARVLPHRGRLLAFADLAALFTPGTSTGPEGRVLIAETIHGPLAFAVDAVDDPVDAVVRPLGARLQPIRVFAGVTVTGDGRSRLVLDLDGLAAQLGVSPRVEPEPAAADQPAAAEERSLLLARSQGRCLGIPADRVLRLLEAEPDRVRHGGDRELLELGGELVALVRLGARTSAGAPIDVVVCNGPSGAVGLVVDAIEDVVTAEVVVPAMPGRPGLARVGDRDELAELLDLDLVDRLVGAPA